MLFINLCFVDRSVLIEAGGKPFGGFLIQRPGQCLHAFGVVWGYPSIYGHRIVQGIELDIFVLLHEAGGIGLLEHPQKLVDGDVHILVRCFRSCPCARLRVFGCARVQLISEREKYLFHIYKIACCFFCRRNGAPPIKSGGYIFFVAL